MEKPTYYGIMPANVRYDRNITSSAKLLYVEITALTNMNGKCTASSNYFADLYGVSRVTIQKWLKELEKNQYINREVIYKQGSKEIDTRYITIVNNPCKEKLTTPSKEKLTDNNTAKADNNINITYSNKLNKKEEFILSKENHLQQPLREWLQYRKKLEDVNQWEFQYKKLKSCNNPSRAVEFSIGNGYTGLFDEKTNNFNKTKQQSVLDRDF
ncbi:MAG: hypothetical protein Unbinned6284contig1004_33 [Prokaryotic dsDNA virus sp.]|nr:MAG: hypothetical protein Unbinned6284contig1004_33 [Prokaryotic dsDNA virus sp.]|tara:strand:- start:1880 stop:2518 length:639 start_codon:yes stop_codon:yes gene_type:complete